MKTFAHERRFGYRQNCAGKTKYTQVDGIPELKEAVCRKFARENNIDDALKEVKRALLDADVSLSVVKEFITEVKEKAIGEEVVRGVNPGQKFIEVVNTELINIMGTDNSPLNENKNKPTVILMAGLQGAGKTTATGKLGLFLNDQDKTIDFNEANNKLI